MADPAREPGEARYLVVATLLVAAAAAALLRGALLGPEVLSQADHLLSFPPWQEVAPEGHEPGNPLLEDQSILMTPWLAYAAGRVAEGEAPLWNPYNFAGQPIHGGLQGAFAWPPNLLYYAFPTLQFLEWHALARIVAAGLGTVLLLRRLGASRGSALAGSAAFAFGGFVVVWLGHPPANAAVLLPWVLWAVERIAARPSWRRSGVLALLLGLQLVGGHLQTALQGGLLVLAWCAWRTVSEVRGTRIGARGWGALAGAALLSLLLAAPQLLPFADYLRESQGVRVLETEEQTADFDPLVAASMIVLPDRFGRPDRGDYAGPEGRNLNYNELAAPFVGRIALALALVGAATSLRDRRARFLAVAALLALLVVWRVPPFYEAFRAIPRVRSTNPMRLSLVSNLALAGLAAFGLDALLSRARAAGRAAAAAGLAAFALVAAELVAWGEGYNPAIPPELAYPPTPATDWLREQPGLWRVEGVDKTTLLASANLPYGLAKLRGYDKIELRPYTELLLELTTQPVEGPLASEILVLDRPEALPLASLLNLRFVLSEEPLPAPFELAHETPGGLGIYENPHVLPRAFVARGAEVVADPAERVRRMGAPDFDPWTALLHAPPEGELARRAADAAVAAEESPAGEVEVVRYAPREVVLRARMERAGLLVLADAWNGGWRASAGGREVPIERVDHALRGVWVDAGEHEIAMHYDPLSFRIAVGLFLAGGAVLVALLAAGGKRVPSPPRV